MKENFRNNKGITLIALVITIIVMLILVTVTIRVATDGNLFTHAANAARDTKTAIQGENAILNDELDSSIEDIVAAQTGESSTPTVTLIHFTIDGTPYDAPDGWTWAAWVADNRYNTDGFTAALSSVYASDGKIVKLSGAQAGVHSDSGIVSDGVYITSSKK